jgi:hypothetical protein
MENFIHIILLFSPQVDYIGLKIQFQNLLAKKKLMQTKMNGIVGSIEKMDLFVFV